MLRQIDPNNANLIHGRLLLLLVLVDTTNMAHLRCRRKGRPFHRLQWVTAGRPRPSPRARVLRNRLGAVRAQTLNAVARTAIEYEGISYSPEE